MAQVIEDTAGKIRDKPITDDLVRLLKRSGEVADIDVVLVTSGGQAAKGTGGKRTGSTRHDNGRAADLKLIRDGRTLDFTKPDDRKIVEVFVSAAAANGATGIGAGKSYMGPETLHVGYGTKAIWGAKGKAANAPLWLKKAVTDGWNNQNEVEQILVDLAPDKNEKDGDQIPFAGAALPLTDKEVSLVAGFLRCEVAALRAVMKVESGGRPFGSDRRPIILNEPHQFYRLLGEGSKRNKAVAKGLAYKKWKTKPYPKTQHERYVWLKQAMGIDETAALCSCSWGSGQVMGFNHKVCGFETVQEFVYAMTHSEGAQLFAVAMYIHSNGLSGSLRQLKWRSFAKGYNGPKYEENNYHTKLKRAYNDRPDSERFVPTVIAEEELRAKLLSFDGREDTVETDVPVVEDAGQIGEPKIVFARNGLNLRGGNSKEFEVLHSLPYGTLVYVISQTGDWALVDLHGDGKADGYMFARFLKDPEKQEADRPSKLTLRFPGEGKIDLFAKLSQIIGRIRD